MISTEVLRRYPFFSFLSANQLNELAMITKEVKVGKGEVLFRIGDSADTLYFLIEGGVELHYVVFDEFEPELRKDFLVGHINPGEVLAISAIIAPHKITSNAVADAESSLLRIDRLELADICSRDSEFAYGLVAQIAKAAMDRLYDTRVLLAAASTPL